MSMLLRRFPLRPGHAESAVRYALFPLNEMPKLSFTSHRQLTETRIEQLRIAIPKYTHRKTKWKNSFSKINAFCENARKQSQPKTDEQPQPLSESADSFTNTKLEYFRNILSTQLKMNSEQVAIGVIKYCNSSDFQTECVKGLLTKIEMLRKHFSTADITYNLQIFALSYRDQEDRINVLKESGIHDLQIKLLYTIPELMTKKCSDLISFQYLKDNISPFEAILKSLEALSLLTPQQIQTIRCYPKAARYIGELNAWHNQTLSTVRLETLKLILKSMLKSSDHVTKHMVESFSEIKNFNQIPLTKMVAIFNVLIHDIQMPINQLIKGFTTFMPFEPDTLKKLAQISAFQSNPALRNAFFKRLKLIQIDPLLVQARLNLVLKHCTIAQLQNYITILELNESDIQRSFETFKKANFLKNHKKSSHFLRLVDNIDLAIVNCEKLEKQGIPPTQISIQDMLIQNDKFATMVDNKDIKLSLGSFVESQFGVQLKEIQQKIGAMKHSFSGNLNLNNAKTIVNFFKDQQVTDEQILNAIYLVYYEFDKIQPVWNDLFNRVEVEMSSLDWRRHPFLLQLVFAFIEKDCIL